MSAASDQIAAIILDARNTATDKANRAVAYTDAAQLAAQGFTSATLPTPVTAGSFTVPPYTPNMQLGDTFKTDFDSIWAGMEGWARGLMNDYVNTHFPILDPAIQTAENTWLLNVVNSGYLGIPVPVETAIWDRARAKDSLEAVRMEDEAVTQFAARGFSLPPGVLANRLQVAQQEAANKSSTIARDLAIKQTEISIDMTKFAITEMTKLRIGLASALAEYMRAWMTLPTAAAEVAKAKAEMSKYLWDSSANYIHALTGKAALQLEADKANQATALDVGKTNVHAFITEQATRVNAAISAAGAMGQIAAATMAGQNTMAHLGDVNSTIA